MNEDEPTYVVAEDIDTIAVCEWCGSLVSNHESGRRNHTMWHEGVELATGLKIRKTNNEKTE